MEPQAVAFKIGSTTYMSTDGTICVEKHFGPGVTLKMTLAPQGDPCNHTLTLDDKGNAQCFHNAKYKVVPTIKLSKKRRREEEEGGDIALRGE